MSEASNTPGTPEASYGRDVPIENTTKALFKSPFLFGPLMKKDTLDLANIDTVQHVVQWSQISLRREIAAAKAQSLVKSPSFPEQQRLQAFSVRREPVSANLRPSAPLPPLKPLAPTTPTKYSTKAKILLILLLVGFLIPVITGIADCISLYSLYSSAHDGVQHLLHVRDILTDLKAHPTNLDSNKLHLAQAEFESAHSDFQQLHTNLNQNVYANALGSAFPGYLSSALALSQIGTDAADIGQELTGMAIILAPALHGALLANTSQPLVTSAMLGKVRASIEYILPRMRDIQAQTPQLSLDILPISAVQREQIAQAIQAIPLAVTDLTQVQNLSDAMGWILGVNEPRTFLVQTMDRAELRPTGGFTGQFGELSLRAGRISPPFKLQNIALYEYGNNPITPNTPPAAYRSWWPVDNWGLRDSNLSADFPTSAKIAIDTYKYEFKHQVDGVIVFSPFLISRILAATGPIYVPEYKETITSLNFEDRLHFYQLDNVGIRKEELVEHVEDPGQARKLFTGRVSKLLMNKVSHASPGDLINIGHEMLHALKTRDLQVYVTNPQIENLLIKYGAAALMDRSTTHDGLFVVQANVNANKGSQYVRTLFHDVVTLNSSGGATHVLQMRLVYHKLGETYGPDTYRDYVRIYVPPTSKFLWGNGFEQLGHPLCGANAGFAPCPTYDAYGNGNLMCPVGQNEPMVETPLLNDPYAQHNHPLNMEGPPTNMVSDEQGRTMYGGWVVVPKNCTMTVTLSWYVPPMGHDPYHLLVQRQSGTYPEMDLTILPTPGNCGSMKTTGKHFDVVLSRDQSFSLQLLNTEEGSKKSCYVQPGV